MRLIDADKIEYTHEVARSLDDGHNWNELCVTKDEIDDMPTVFQTMNQQEHKSLVEWKEDFKGFVECLDMPRDDYNGIMAYIDEVPSAEPRKKGKWIKIPEFCGDDVSGFVDNHFSCSECKKEAEINSWGFYILSDFCPNCGARMVSE